MKYKILFFLFVTFWSYSQTANKNYVLKTVFKAENNQNPEKTIEYYDSFGRSTEKIMYQQGADGTDLITFKEYDSYGNETKGFLPYSDILTSSLNSRPINTNLFNIHYYFSSFIEDQDEVYFTQNELEKSPLKRVQKTSHPGDVWQMGFGKEIKSEFTFNDTNDSIINYTVNTSYDTSNKIFLNSITNSVLFNVNKLFKKIVKNENWIISDGKNNTREVYTDNSGKIILERNYNEGKKHDTYYLYDKYGNQVYILPPNMKHNNFSSADLENLAYQYRYDSKDRVVEKKMPNRGWEAIVYDKQDRVVLEQSILQKNKEWIFKKYDNLNRLVYSGIFKNTASRSAMQNALNSMQVNPFNNENRSATTFTNNSNAVYYANNAFPNGSLTIDNINYYDYHYDQSAQVPNSNTFGHSILNNTKKMKGLLLSNHMNVIGTDKWNKDLYYYESKFKHLIATSKQLFEGGERLEDSKVDFLGNIHETFVRQKLTANSPIVNITTKYFYNPNSSLEKVTQKIDDNPEQLLFSQTLDPFGKVKIKKIGGTDLTGNTYLQKIDFKYNIRGWLTDVNDVNDLTADNDVFAFKINREVNGFTRQYDLFDGNIASVIWRSKKDNVIKRYLYEYDDLNRLKEGGYFNQPSFGLTQGWILKTGAFKEQLTYDKIGNITSLNRTGAIVNDNVIEIDALSYHYDANKLVKVVDATNNGEGFSGVNISGNDYNYDLHGNLVSDRNKEISEIKYNYLNLPSEIKQGSNSIKYYYTPDGNKVRKILENSFGTHITTLINDFEYENDNFSILKHSEGYVTKNGNNYNYTFIFKDHLGNNRISFEDKNGNGYIDYNEISDEYTYYPFGLMHTAENNNLYKYKYQGIEKENDLNLGWYNYKYRSYSPEIGKFLSVDPLADKYDFLSNYAYTDNNPMNLVDVDGREIYVVSNGMEYKYNRNLITFSNDLFVITAFNSLNTIASTKIGNAILTPLINTSQKIYVSNTFSSVGTMTYNMDTKIIDAAPKGHDFNTYTITMGHELYHSLQDLFGIASQSINTELEAYIIDNMLSYEITGIANQISGIDEDGDKFSNSYERLFRPEVQMNDAEFNRNFIESLKHFKRGTYMGQEGIYDKFKIENKNPSNLLKSFFIVPFDPGNYGLIINI